MTFQAQELTPDRSARHLFGAEIRRLRTDAELSLLQLAKVVNYSKSGLARVETAEGMPPPDLAQRLDAAFGTDGHFVRLCGLARKEIHPDQYRRRMELEARARVIEEYGGQLVPGLAQTEDYARAIFRVSNPKATEDTIDGLTTARLSRQFQGDRSPDLAIILDEAVIRRPVGGPDVMRAQLAHLLTLVHTPTSVLQVLPFAHGEHALMGGSLTLLTLDDRSTVAYEESIDTGVLLEDPDSVSKRRRAYDLMRAYALSPSESAALIRSVMEALPYEHHP